jgi:hypothetical protein
MSINDMSQIIDSLRAIVEATEKPTPHAQHELQLAIEHARNLLERLGLR